MCARTATRNRADPIAQIQLTYKEHNTFIRASSRYMFSAIKVRVVVVVAAAAAAKKKFSMHLTTWAPGVEYSLHCTHLVR